MAMRIDALIEINSNMTRF